MTDINIGNLTESLNNKSDRDLNNSNKLNLLPNFEIAGIDISSETSYTPIEDGYIVANVGPASSSCGLFFNEVRIAGITSGNTFASFCIPVKGGVTYTLDGSGTDRIVKFYPLYN